VAKKTKYNELNFIPISINFSQMSISSEEDLEFDIGDDGNESEVLYDTLELEMNIMEILHNLDNREKIIFLYQLMRESGYRFDYTSCAKTLHISRKWYMMILKQVKSKAKFILQEYKRHKETT
jgi:hypothetical protein